MIVIAILHLFGSTMDAMVTLIMTCIPHNLFNEQMVCLLIFSMNLYYAVSEEGFVVNQLSSLKF